MPGIEANQEEHQAMLYRKAAYLTKWERHARAAAVFAAEQALHRDGGNHLAATLCQHHAQHHAKCARVYRKLHNAVR